MPACSTHAARALNVLYSDVPAIAPDCAAIVDALYGTGLNRPLEALPFWPFSGSMKMRPAVIAVDIPSGVDGSSGHVLGEAVHAQETVTFHRAKHGHMLFSGRALTGKLTIADIGILPEWDGAQGMDILEDADARALLPARPRDGHKGTFGHVLCVAGSEGMAGAAVLCARAALRAGAGLVTAPARFPCSRPCSPSLPARWQRWFPTARPSAQMRRMRLCSWQRESARWPSAPAWAGGGRVAGH